MKKSEWELSKQYWRDIHNNPFYEAICPHGIGHHKGIHGCDGCCSKAPKEIWDKVSSDIEQTAVSATGTVLSLDNLEKFNDKNKPIEKMQLEDLYGKTEIDVLKDVIKKQWEIIDRVNELYDNRK